MQVFDSNWQMLFWFLDLILCDVFAYIDCNMPILVIWKCLDALHLSFRIVC